ncbi:MAG: hypothetical protein A2W61_04080 [Deltaproteobacteria bacterium RIFCSPLOWO2_01_44_7]|nr:MAG: hypothetical protein A2712_07250 [Deltaproteobacteria bacterium RIFCSPHIGHO2_01_FULL_43_49]OGQ15741.1 MAG: hypothetical protein A3D22_06040 [Deltaproteobacteria bacterium RIFCSPHIGHO2_02_FULL_44_53]OGQ39568.1 MAG: hypothetical protein A2W61_04080 [Deltaproteobacteria bacterium RIFCSPLOWO2_01_44_7]OGQ43645.1 MAG: hypothetical protein A3I70_03500 [Deltaproteobacteria bacterium RIFCSPLOWO2_02_FULL_44_34]
MICNERYLTNLEIRRRIPKDWDSVDILSKVHQWREHHKVPTPLLNQGGKPFFFCSTQHILKAQSVMDRYGYDTLFENIPSKAIEKIEKDNLLEEAFFSSQIEGAKTTRRRAEEMIRHNSLPRDRSERETLNNYRAMEYILSNPDKKISIETITDLHRIVTDNALDDGKPGEFRTPEHDTVVGDALRIYYVPPTPEKIEGFLEYLIQWLHPKDITISDASSLHPLSVASILHFYFVYIHPFPDGNGRTARALYYLYLNKFYNAMPFLSISHVIGQKRKAYDQAILNVEETRTDLTFFIHYSCDITTEAIDNLRFAIQRYATASHLEDLVGKRSLELNKRQMSIIKYLLRPDISHVDVKKYQKLQKIVYETARTDLQELEKKGFLVSRKIGKKFIYQLKEESHD